MSDTKDGLESDVVSNYNRLHTKKGGLRAPGSSGSWD